MLISNRQQFIFAKYLKSSKNYPTSPEEILNFYRIAKELSDIPFPIINTLNTNKDLQNERIITIKFENIFGVYFSDLSNFKLNADLFYRNSLIQSNLRQSSENNQYKIYIETDKIADFNKYELFIEYSYHEKVFEVNLMEQIFYLLQNSIEKVFCLKIKYTWIS